VELQEPLPIQATPVQQDSQGILDPQVSQGVREIQELLGLPDLKDLLVQLETMVLLVSQVPRVGKEPKVKQEIQVPLE
jgi:hypothetical protein